MKATAARFSISMVMWLSRRRDFWTRTICTRDWSWWIRIQFCETPIGCCWASPITTRRFASARTRLAAFEISGNRKEFLWGSAATLLFIPSLRNSIRSTAAIPLRIEFFLRFRPARCRCAGPGSLAPRARDAQALSSASGQLFVRAESAVAMRTCEGLPNSVQAKCTSSPSRAIRGKPLEREILVSATIETGPSKPSGVTRRTLMLRLQLCLTSSRRAPIHPPAAPHPHARALVRRQLRSARRRLCPHRSRKQFSLLATASLRYTRPLPLAGPRRQRMVHSPGSH